MGLLWGNISKNLDFKVDSWSNFCKIDKSVEVGHRLE